MKFYTTPASRNNMMYRELYQQTNLPIFQNRLYNCAKAAQNSPTGNIYLVQDTETGLIHNKAFEPNLLDYDRSYNNDQSYSPLFKKHMVEVADLIESLIGTKELIEIGCGKGQFLELLLSRGSEIVGFDPTYEGHNNLIRREYFDSRASLKGIGVILRHVLEHIQEPINFLHEIAKANAGKGLIYIEVPCFDWICKNKAWFDIFYEHVNYFRLSDFSRIFKNIVHSSRTFGGQYLSIIADLSSLKRPKYNTEERIVFPSDFLSSLTPKKFSINNKKTVVWGGASKGVIFSLLAERAGMKVDRVIDICPDKQGLFLPGTGLRVMSPKEGLNNLPQESQIYVMNPNYLEEVRAMVGPDHKCNSISV